MAGKRTFQQRTLKARTFKPGHWTGVGTGTPPAVQDTTVYIYRSYTVQDSLVKVSPLGSDVFLERSDTRVK